MKNFRLDIGGPKGNAFYIMGTVSSLVDNKAVCDGILAEMKKSDYNHLLETFVIYFGDSVTLYSHTELSGVDEILYELVDSDIIEL